MGRWPPGCHAWPPGATAGGWDARAPRQGLCQAGLRPTLTAPPQAPPARAPAVLAYRPPCLEEAWRAALGVGGPRHAVVAPWCPSPATPRGEEVDGLDVEPSARVLGCLKLATS